ncbi:MAG: D-alanine--D-alanine ligase [Fibrobacteria bacterium]|nr:D-alanine--D-alanine ligase [Fibrobacteria bacterium]
MAKQLPCVGVIMGGVSPEHDVSLHSGSVMLQNLDATRYRGFPLIISKQNTWLWPDTYLDWEHTPFSFEMLQDIIVNPPKDWHQANFPDFNKFPHCDIFLLALHGVGGEDGLLQGFFDLCGQRYTGSGCLGSALAMDKIMTKKMYQQWDIPTPPFAVFNKETLLIKQLEQVIAKFGFPLVIKDPLGGSSLGVEVASSKEDCLNTCETMLTSCKEILLEKFIQGKEGTCGYIQNFKELPPTEIIPLHDGFFNYEAKYLANRTKELTPGNFTTTQVAQMQELAQKCHTVLKLSIYSRTDFLIQDNDIFVLETNSLPGFTATSLLPQQARAVGLDYSALLSKIIDESLQK